MNMLESIKVRDPSVAGMSDLLERIARGNANVVIHGELGVGKEVLARSLHACSGRAGELTVVRCAALDEPQMARELFGFEQKPGLLELAGNGTVLFDEVGELSPDIQMMLVRMIEMKQVFRVGCIHARPLAARLITTSHVPTAELVLRGKLREDLHKRLAGITLELLPLRERRAEIVDLAQELLVEAVRETAFPTTRFTASAMATLVQYDWPGNVRELRLVVARAALLAGPTPIEAHHLLLETRNRSRSEIEPQPRNDFVTLAREHRGNASAIARALHTSRSQVRRLASRFQVDLELLRRQ